MKTTKDIGRNVEVISLTGSGATKILVAGESGSIILLGGSDASTVTLPPVEDGLWFKIYVTSEAQHVVKAQSDVMQGNYRHNSATTTMTRIAISDKGKLTLHSSGRAIGDTLEFYCDGTNWYVDGIVNNALTQATL